MTETAIHDFVFISLLMNSVQFAERGIDSFEGFDQTEVIVGANEALRESCLSKLVAIRDALVATIEEDTAALVDPIHQAICDEYRIDDNRRTSVSFVLGMRPLLFHGLKLSPVSLPDGFDGSSVGRYVNLLCLHRFLIGREPASH
jgi:hypothetical protein